MFMNLGALQKVMDILEMPLQDATQELYELYLKLYDFLCLFCEKNTFNQDVVYQRRETFFGHMTDNILTHSAGKLMATIFEDNKMLLESVDETFFTRIFKFIEATNVPAWLGLLCSLCTLKGERHSRNCAQVMKRLSANPDLLTLYSGLAGT